MNKTSGKFDKTEKGIYFLALFVTEFVDAYQALVKSLSQDTRDLLNITNVLIEAGHLFRDINIYDKALSLYKNVFIDSGVFSIANKHAKDNNMSFEEGIKLKTKDLPIFEDYFKKYIEIGQIGLQKGIWGIVEVDLGGTENKIETRYRIEKQGGFIPIPVYHSLNDDWEYFKDLCKKYDRICVSNLVQTNTPNREIIMYKINEYLKSIESPPYIHWLGVSPSVQTFFNTFGSCDSSSWSMFKRFGNYHVRVQDFTLNTLECYKMPIGLSADDYASLNLAQLINRASLQDFEFLNQYEK